MISRALKQRWIEALRSGKYRQGRSRLKDFLAGAVFGGEPHYSCIGVLAELAGVEFHSQQDYRTLDEVDLHGLLGPYKEDSLQWKLLDLNEGTPGNESQPKSFAEIADWIETNVPCDAPLDNVVQLPLKTQRPEAAVKLCAPGNQNIDSVTAGIERVRLALPGKFLVIIWMTRVTEKGYWDAIAHLLSFEDSAASRRCAFHALELLIGTGAEPEATATANGPHLRQLGVPELARASVCIGGDAGQATSHVSAMALGPFPDEIIGAKLIDQFGGAREKDALRKFFLMYGRNVLPSDWPPEEQSPEIRGSLAWVETQLRPLVGPELGQPDWVEKRITQLADQNPIRDKAPPISERDPAERILEAWPMPMPQSELQSIGEIGTPEEIEITASGSDVPLQNENGVLRVLYFREAPHDTYLVFVPPERGLFVDRIHRAISESRTWGEFRERLPASEYQGLFGGEFIADSGFMPEHGGAREPRDDEAFSSDGVPGYADGDYPPWLALEQELYVPMQILKKFATWEDTFVNGTFCRIDFRHTHAIVEALRKMGYQVERRDDLMFW